MSGVGSLVATPFGASNSKSNQYMEIRNVRPKMYRLQRAAT